MTPEDRLTPEERFELCGVHFPKVTVCRRPGYIIQFEQCNDSTFAHATVTHWTPSARVSFVRDLDALQVLLDGPLLVLCPLANTKLRKFCGLVGFHYALSLTTNDGEDSEILIRYKKNK